MERKGERAHTHRESKGAGEQVFDGHVMAWRDRGKTEKKRVCARNRDKRGAEDRSAHLSTSSLGAGGGTHCPQWLKMPHSGAGLQLSGDPAPSRPIAWPHFSLSRPCYSTIHHGHVRKLPP